jgi:hypothetical protein
MLLPSHPLNSPNPITCNPITASNTNIINELAQSTVGPGSAGTRMRRDSSVSDKDQLKPV